MAAAKAEILWRSLFEATERMRSHQNDLLRDDTISHLTLSQINMIQQLYSMIRENGCGVTLKELTARLGITPAAGSEMVEALVRKKVLCRRQSESDRRQVDIQLDPLWFSRFRKIEGQISRITAGFLNTLPEEEQKKFIACSSALASYMKQLDN